MTKTTFTFDATTTLESVAAAYAAADVSGKSAMRAWRVAAMTDAVKSGDMDAAMAYAAMESAMVTVKSSGPTVDYVARIRDIRATLVAAIDRIDRGEVIMPDGVAVPDIDGLEGGTVDDAMVTRYVTVSGRKSGRGDVAAYVDSVLGDAPMTVAQLRAAWTASDDYPTAAPTSGAIAAMLDRDGAADYGITVTTVDGVKGATR